MSNQDEISRLLAEANAQAEAAAQALEAQKAAAQASVPKPPQYLPRSGAQNNVDVLGVAWLNGALCGASFRRQKMLKSWTCEVKVRTMADFEAVIDELLAKVEFAGTEMFLLLANEVFAHHAETIPAAFSSSAARAYLKGRVQRYQQEHGPVLWVSQSTSSIKQEQHSILHLLPTSFYDQLQKILQKRHLDLTRILPQVVPIQYELNKIPANRDTPVLVVAEVGANTKVVAGRIGGSLMFTRTILANINQEGGRVGVEVNRSLLFAKQHHDCAIERIWVMVDSCKALPDLKAKCGTGRKITILPTTLVDWLQTAIRIPSEQPINLLASYLKRKLQHRIIRYIILALGWLGLTLTIFSCIEQAKSWNVEAAHFAALRKREVALMREGYQLLRRNTAIERAQSMISQVETGRLPPVPGRLIGFIASILPSNVRLTEFNVKREFEAEGWSFRLDGVIEADEEMARDLMINLQRQLENSPFRVRYRENARLFTTAASTAFNRGTEEAPTLRFSLEGVALEK